MRPSVGSEHTACRRRYPFQFLTFFHFFSAQPACFMKMVIARRKRRSAHKLPHCSSSTCKQAARTVHRFRNSGRPALRAVFLRKSPMGLLRVWHCSSFFHPILLEAGAGARRSVAKKRHMHHVLIQLSVNFFDASTLLGHVPAFLFALDPKIIS